MSPNIPGPPQFRAAFAAVMRATGRAPAAVLLALIRLYQRTLSPVLPIVTLGSCGCRFSPTCSHYAAEAVRRHGAVAGAWLALKRLVKCTPLHPGGFDPVPACRSAPRSRRAHAAWSVEPARIPGRT